MHDLSLHFFYFQEDDPLSKYFLRNSAQYVGTGTQSQLDGFEKFMMIAQLPKKEREKE